jgi:4-diphosphocytidyl-2-C-methyl-D-erythritol kinase
VTVLRALAPGKVNLSLCVGAPRADGLHPLASVVQAVSLADELTLGPAGPGATADEVVCPGVEGPNLAADALAAFRAATGWDAPPQRLEIVKRVPVAAGMGGGSGDAAAALRLAAQAAGGAEDALLHELAVGLGADVPGQLRPGRVVMLGAGERVVRLPDPPVLHLVIVPLDAALSTPAVYRAFDELGGAREPGQLEAIAARLTAGELPDELLVNDLQDAARSLCPAIDPALGAVRATGARHALVSGSGPTVFGLYGDGPEADAAAAALAAAYPRAVAVVPVGPGEADAVEADAVEADAVEADAVEAHAVEAHAVEAAPA